MCQVQLENKHQKELKHFKNQQEESNKKKQQHMEQTAQQIQLLKKKIQEAENLGEQNKALSADLERKKKEYGEAQQTFESMEKKLITVNMKNADAIANLADGWAEEDSQGMKVPSELRVPVCRRECGSQKIDSKAENWGSQSYGIPCRKTAGITPRLAACIAKTMENLAVNDTSKFQQVLTY